MRKILITGGSGYVGRHLIRELLDRYADAEIISVSRSEGAISQLLTECGDKRLKIAMGDVRDKEFIRYYSRGVETMIHLAALKRVDICEQASRESVQVNIMGTMNMLDAFHGKTFIQMSTDKAVEPVNCYGASKLIAERLVMEQAVRNGNGARYMIVRSGNVLDSTGSVLDIWRRQIKDRNEITVTNPQMLRFYTTIAGVVRLFIAVIEKGESGKIYFTPVGEAIMLKDMVEKVIKLYGNQDTRVKYIGLRPGERMYEKIHNDEEEVVMGFEKAVELAGKTPAVAQVLVA